MSLRPPDHSDPADRWRHTGDQVDSGSSATLRPPYRPPIGIPAQRPRRWPLSVSFVLHALIVMIMAAPAFVAAALPLVADGAGGPGPAGGGGGGTRGTGGRPEVVERLQYMHTAPAPAPTVVQPVEVPPVTPPPVEETNPPPAPKIDIDIEQPKQTMDLALAAGIGGGTGNDGTSGSGSGTGGGVGTGVGTGRGSGTGPGTGGGEGTIYPPTPDFTLIPPFPIPQRVKGRTVTLLFTIDERGVVKKVELAPGTGDGKYDRRLIEQYLNATFRPASKWDGTAVAAIFPMQVALY